MKLSDNPQFQQLGEFLLTLVEAWNNSPLLKVQPTKRAFMAATNDKRNYQLIIFRGTMEESLKIREFLRKMDED